MLASPDRERVLGQIQLWSKELINLARSNRLLYFRHTRSSTLEIQRPGDQVADVVDHLLAGRTWRFYIPPEIEDGAEMAAGGEEHWPATKAPASNELVTNKADARGIRGALRQLERRATQEFMDKGIWILYLAAGVLRWFDPDTEEQAESPLVLVPVELHRKNPQAPYELRRVDEDIVMNPALGVRLEDFGIELPVVDAEDLELDALLDHIQRLVAERPNWEVQRRLLISPFSFHKEVMYRDLLKNKDEIAAHGLVQSLALGPEAATSVDFDPISEECLDEVSPPEEATAILDADATQSQCVAAGAAGHSFVMDGPPGTGKSQTIANLIAELIGKGKTVLFVSEKAAALEVVNKRLDAAGLGDYALELHSHKATRKEVAQQLGRSLSHHPRELSMMPEVEASQLRRRRLELTSRANAMNERREPLGKTLYEVIGRIAHLHGCPQAPPSGQIDTGFTASELAAAMTASEELARAWGPVSRAGDFLWRDLHDERLDSSRRQRTEEQVTAALRQLAAVKESASDEAEALLQNPPRTIPEVERLARAVELVQQRPHVPAGWLVAASLDAIHEHLEERRARADQHTQTARSADGQLGDRWRDVDLAPAALLSEADERLRQLEPPFALSGDLSVSALPERHRRLERGAELLAHAAEDSAAISESFGLHGHPSTLERVDQLAELALLAAAPAKPEASWLDPIMIDAATNAAETLEPLCSRVVELQRALTSVFNDEVLSLDLGGLQQRFSEMHSGLGKLKSSYRADKRTLAGVTRSGKAGRKTVALLPRALEWQELSHELDTAEQRYAPVLGDYYYRGAETSFDELTSVLASARRALDLAGREVDLPALKRELARDGQPGPELVLSGRRLRETLAAWSEIASADPYLEVVASGELRDAASTLERASANLKQVISAAAQVQEAVGRDLSVAQARQASLARTLTAAIEAELRGSVETDRAILGELYGGLHTNWDQLTRALEWTQALREALDGPLTAAAAVRVLELEINTDEVCGALQRWTETSDAVLSNFGQHRAIVLREELSVGFGEAAALLDALRRTVGDIEEWVEYQQARNRLADLGLLPAVVFCEERRVAPELVPPVIERACLESWADAVLRTDQSRINHLRADQLNHIVDEFRNLDRSLVRHGSARVIAACNRRRPRTTVGAAGVIRREAEKQRRHMPVRKLLEESGEVAQLLKPCFMMSPLTVSQFLPPSLKFDAIVFDEASQVRPSDAINCVYRGTQLIVAGDDKQLPPTSFFEVVSMDGDDEYEEDQFEEFESILKLCKSGGLHELPLRWHYRSQHEDLIAYSNASFYAGELVTFPGAVENSDELGVKFLHVPDGIYRRGTARDNPREAEVVADRVMHWARRQRALSVGVVAFSEAQAAAIESAVEKRRRDAPELDEFFAEDRLDGFFVKNLENVQGDERDVMLFSVGYGRDENRKLTMNFGPVNREGGQRRLNVAITRARQRVEVVSSITGSEPEFNTELKEGVRHLRRYLDYAERGHSVLALELSDIGLDAESPFEEEVIRTIRSWSYDAVPQVGTAGYRVDIGVKHPEFAGRYALGVECDGWMYHSSKVARDRDRLRQEVLEGLGWSIYRIWGTAWYRHREEQERRLKEAIANAIAAPDTPTTQIKDNPALETIDAPLEPVPLDQAPTWAVPYKVARPLSFGTAHLDMHVPEAQPHLRRMIQEVVEVEGPVRDEVVLRRVREAWGVGRAGKRIRESFEARVRSLSRRTEVVVLEDGRFLSVPNRAIAAVRVPGSDPEARRSIDEVPSAELQLAILNLVRGANRVSRDELTFEVAQLFGWNRRGADIAAGLDRAVDRLVREERITERDGYLGVR